MTSGPLRREAVHLGRGGEDALGHAELAQEVGWEGRALLDRERSVSRATTAKCQQIAVEPGLADSQRWRRAKV